MSQINRHHENFKKFDKILKDVDDVESPAGTMNKPARTCREMFEQKINKNKKTGDYFIDPTEGSSNDAVLVHCVKETGETCIKPVDGFKVESKNWGDFKDQYKWAMGDLQEGEIKYNMPSVQMKLLQTLSYGARQNFTYNCKNSWAFNDASGKTIENPLKIKVDSEEVETLTSKVSSRNMMYEIIKDECASAKHGIWKNTVVEFKSKIAEQLPILDVAAHDIGDYSEEFGIEVGPVCFK
jgi:hypothetical protein